MGQVIFNTPGLGCEPFGRDFFRKMADQFIKDGIKVSVNFA